VFSVFKTHGYDNVEDLVVLLPLYGGYYLVGSEGIFTECLYFALICWGFVTLDDRDDDYWYNLCYNGPYTAFILEVEQTY
jgi:hypothetical protein